MSAYETNTGDIVVEGVLKDDRWVPIYRPSGEKRPPHTVHHMVIRMRIDVSTFAITDIEAEMPEIPHNECPQTLESLAGIKGMQVAPGFTAKVKKRLGGVKGCSHLTGLVCAMAPTVVQAVWVCNSQNPKNVGMLVGMLDGYLADTCWVWRKDGPTASQLRENRKESS